MAATFVQTPMLPVRLQALHALRQAVLQQTPCAQLPVAHSVPEEQDAPIIFGPHELMLQTFGGAQLASAEQLPKHLLPLQTYG